MDKNTCTSCTRKSYISRETTQSQFGLCATPMALHPASPENNNNNLCPRSAYRARRVFGGFFLWKRNNRNTPLLIIKNCLESETAKERQRKQTVNAEHGNRILLTQYLRTLCEIIIYLSSLGCICGRLQFSPSLDFSLIYKMGERKGHSPHTHTHARTLTTKK